MTTLMKLLKSVFPPSLPYPPYPSLSPVAGGRKEMHYWAKGFNSTPEAALWPFHLDTDIYQTLDTPQNRQSKLLLFSRASYWTSQPCLSSLKKGWGFGSRSKSCPEEEPGSLLKPCWRVAVLLANVYECFEIASPRGWAEITMLTLELSPEFLGGEGRNPDPRPAICADDPCLQTT